MAKGTKFLSKFKDHKLVMTPTRMVVQDGMSYSVPGKAIQFQNYRYETNDKDEIKFLEKHRLFGTDILKDTESLETKASKPKEKNEERTNDDDGAGEDDGKKQEK